VIEALYGKDKGSLNSIRFSFGRDTKKEDLDFTIKTIDNILKKLKVWYK
jgi:cysteine sulfinate desulfinase/cysteine desulfurase-like protein